jgi:hypothetical protein
MNMSEPTPRERAARADAAARNLAKPDHVLKREDAALTPAQRAARAQDHAASLARPAKDAPAARGDACASRTDDASPIAYEGITR